MLLFKDLSLHYYQKNNYLWQREEALSQIVQMEILDTSAVKSGSQDADAEFNQMKKMHGQMLDKATAKSKRKKKGKFGAEATQSRMSPPKARGTDGRTSVTIGRRALDTE